MKRLKRRSLLATIIIGALVSGGSVLAADSSGFPSRPVTLVVPFSPGGGVDLMARFYSKKLSEKWGQPVVVDNRPGAGGTIGTSHVAQARPDGYTLLFTSVAHAINPSFYPNLPFDALQDFEPISAIAKAPNGIAVNPDTPFKTLAELVAYAKKNPGQLTYGAISGSTTMHLGMAMFEKAAGIQLQYIPYKGTMASVQAAMTGEVNIVSSGYASSDTFAKEGKLRMLAVSSEEPTSLAPGIPTIASAADLPGFEVMNWMGMLAPAGTPKSVIQQINQDLKSIGQGPETAAFYKTQKNEMVYQTPEDFRNTIVNEIGRYEKIISGLGLGMKYGKQ